MARDTMKTWMPIARQFGRFALVGAAATSVHYLILIALKELASVGVVWATTAGYAVGAVVSYTLNRAFTFEVRPAYGAGLVKFLGVILLGAGINALIVALLAGAGMHYLLAQAIATGLVLIWNFLAARALVFRT
jgi:putative flippase GtrA